MAKKPRTKTKATARPADKKPNPGEQLVNKRGRPFAIKDGDVARHVDDLEKLGHLRCTTKECAAFLKISEPTLFAFFERCPEAKDAYESGKEMGKLSQRRDLLALGKTNGSVAIFLAMNELGMKDKRFLGLKQAQPSGGQQTMRVLVKGGLPPRQTGQPANDATAGPVAPPARATPVLAVVESGAKK